MAVKKPEMIEVDLSEFRKLSGCSLSKLELDEVQQRKVDAALLAPDISASAIRDVIRNWGFRISSDTITSHRSQRCACKLK
jgi:hypothetical protein